MNEESVMAHFDEKLKNALIVDSNISTKYVHDLACWAKKQDNLEVSSLIIQKKKSNSSGKLKSTIIFLRKTGVTTLLDKIGHSFLVKIEKLL